MHQNVQQLDENTKLMVEFNKEQEEMLLKLDKTMSETKLRAMCVSNQDKCIGAVCRKIEEIKESLKDTERKVDHNREVVNSQLQKIVTSLGRVEGKLESLK